MINSIDVKNKITSDRVIKIAPFKKEVRVTTPHKHNNYFEIIFLSKGSGFHSIDSQLYEVKPPVIYFVRKEQIHYWELTSEPEGYVLIIKKSFIELSMDKEIKTLLYKLSKFAVLNLKKTETLAVLLELLTKENQLENPAINPVVEGLLKAFLAKLLQEGLPFSQNKEKKADLYDAFRDLLSQQDDLKNNVAYYATKLNTSAQNLNTVCRKVGNVSAAQVLSEFILSEAKRLLIYTDNTISEIAFLLNFNDASHFVKYFKRYTNCTPGSFRIVQ